MPMDVERVHLTNDKSKIFVVGDSSSVFILEDGGGGTYSISSQFSLNSLISV